MSLSDVARAEARQRQYAERAEVVAVEVAKRKAAEAERDEAVAYAGVLEALLEIANERIATESLRNSQCGGACYAALLP